MVKLPCLFGALVSTILTFVKFFQQDWKAALPMAIVAVVLWLLGLFFSAGISADGSHVFGDVGNVKESNLLLAINIGYSP